MKVTIAKGSTTTKESSRCVWSGLKKNHGPPILFVSAFVGLAACCCHAVLEGTTTPHYQHSDLSGTRDMTIFERELDRLRMNAMHHHHNGNRKLISASCSEICQQCIPIDTYFHLSGYRINPQNESSPWMIPHPRSEFRKFEEEMRNRTDARIFPDEIAPGRFSTVDDIYQLIEAQMQVLNKLYAETPFYFRWVNNDPTNATVAVENDFAFFYAGNIHRSNDYSRAMHQGDIRTLNVYLIYRICGHRYVWVDSNCKTIGAATNPSYQLDGTADGVYLAYDTLTGGGFEDYDTGLSLAHEVGHWLGLLHVFQSETLQGNDEDSSSTSRIGYDGDGPDPCDPINAVRGDFVDDTPFLPRPSVMMYRCPMDFYAGQEIPNSCPKLLGVDPVFNIMNYVGSEHCLDGHAEFTCGQRERMYQQWMLYRDHNEDCAPNEMMINLTMVLDANFSNVQVEISQLEGQQPIFNLQRDMHLSLFPEHIGNATRIMNFCVPQGTYVLAVTDLGRDGFANGSFLELSVNGEIIRRVEGNFGSTECIKFDNTNGILADLQDGPADFGTAHHFELGADGQATTVTCSAAKERFLQEPIPIQSSRFMRVNVSLVEATRGVCINDVSKLDIGIDGSVKTVYPRDDDDSVFIDSEIISCRGEHCIVEFDLAHLVGVYDPGNKEGIYNTTCTANVKIGFGEACDEFLKAGNIDCVAESHEVFSTAHGRIFFSMPVLSSAATRSGFWSTLSTVLTCGIGALMMMI